MIVFLNRIVCDQLLGLSYIADYEKAHMPIHDLICLACYVVVTVEKQPTRWVVSWVYGLVFLSGDLLMAVALRQRSSYSSKQGWLRLVAFGRTASCTWPAYPTGQW